MFGKCRFFKLRFFLSQEPSVSDPGPARHFGTVPACAIGSLPCGFPSLFIVGLSFFVLRVDQHFTSVFLRNERISFPSLSVCIRRLR